MKTIDLIRTLFVAVMLTCATTAFAQPVHRSPQEARGLLEQAVATLQKNGPENAFAQFSDRKGPFVKGELYVFTIDMNGIYKASGADSALVGTNALDLKDAAGKPIFRDMIEVAKTKGEGIIDYVWLNRPDNRVEQKHSYIKRVGDFIVGVGYYVK